VLGIADGDEWTTDATAATLDALTAMLDGRLPTVRESSWSSASASAALDAPLPRSTLLRRAVSTVVLEVVRF
jgi:hypothetical protein